MADLSVPANPKIYHIVHIDRLPSIIASGGLISDAGLVESGLVGTTIGMSTIKQRRLSLPLESHTGLCVGQCVPFYFCPRSIMLYLIHRANHSELAYLGGQGPVVHLEADLGATVQWAGANDLRWVFSLSNAGSNYFEDRDDLDDLHEIDWEAVRARDWRRHKEGKQAEFLVESFFGWELVERIGVHSEGIAAQAQRAMAGCSHKPGVEVIRRWYY